eukprot:TRINITY_DN56114_c0_g1_i1.p1 TRINITY_DN56114_c0_g1~~TRINITY_DN56114_c0_g1_i1.p1  ORF type:complete len:602 (+),score=181.93 TRINITY_DN56114_c0_g1_i1:76-1806(+)
MHRRPSSEGSARPPSAVRPPARGSLTAAPSREPSVDSQRVAPPLLAASSGDDTTTEEKCVDLFHEFAFEYEERLADVQRKVGGPANRYISEELFISTLARLNTGFSAETARELFGKLCAAQPAETQPEGAEDKTGQLTYAGFHLFCEWYPTVLKCLYFRAKDYWRDVIQKQILEREKLRVQDLLAKAQSVGEESAKSDAAHAAAQERHSRLQRDADAAYYAAQGAGAPDGEHGDSVPTKVALEEAHGRTLRARDELRHALAELETEREREARHIVDLGLDQLQRGIVAANVRVEDADADVAVAKQQLRELEQLVANMKEEVQRREDVAQSRREDLAAAQDALRVASADDPQLQAAQRAEERVLEAERALADSQADEEAAAREHCERDKEAQDAMAEAAKAADAASDAERAAEKLRDALRRAKRLSDAAASRLKEMELANREFNEMRQAREQEERAVIAQELKLVEQRQCLERMEAALREQSTRVVTMAEKTPTPAGPQWQHDIPRGPVSAAPELGGPDHSPCKPAPLPGRGDYDERYSRPVDHVGEPFAHESRHSTSRSASSRYSSYGGTHGMHSG